MNRGFAATLARVRGRLAWRQTTERSAQILSASGTVLLLSILAPARWPSEWVLRSQLALLAAALAGLLWTTAQARWTWRSDEVVARFIDHRLGSGDLVWSAAELLHHTPAEASPTLVHALVGEATDRSRRAELLVDFRSAHQQLRVAVLVVLLLVLTLMFGPRLRPAERLRPPAPNGEPLIADLELTLTYPRYMGIPTRVIAGSSGDLLAPPGTQVALRARPLLPTQHAELQLEDGNGKRLSTTSAPLLEGKLTASLSVAQSGGYRFAIQPLGRTEPLLEPEAHPIAIDPDHPPRIDLAAPADELELDAPRPVELAYSAEDDFGLGAIELVWGPASSPKSAKRRAITTPTGRSASGKFEWDLRTIALRPGVRIAYHFEARDNDEVSGPKVGRSRTLFVRLHSPAEQHHELLAQLRQLLDRMVLALGDRLETPLSDEVWQGLHQKSQALLDRLGQIEALLAKDSLAPKSLKPALVGLRERLSRLHQQENGTHWTSLHPRIIAELENGAIQIDDLLGRMQLEQLLSAADQMAQARDRLKELIAKYQRTKSEEVRRQIEQDLAELRERLAELQAQAAQLARELPDEFLNREALHGQDLGQELDALEQLLKQGKTDGLEAELNRLSQSIDQMVASLEHDLRGFKGERFSEEERALAELENSLRDLEKEERQIRSETGEVQERMQKRLQESERGRLEAFWARARAEVATMKRHLDEIERRPLPDYHRDQIDLSHSGIDRLERALDLHDIDEARAMAEQAADRLRDLGSLLQQWGAMTRNLTMARSQAQVGADADGAKRLAEELRRLASNRDQLLPSDDRQQLDQLRGQQAATRRRAEEAAHKLGDRAGLRPGLEHARQHMQRAEDRLGAADPRGSASAEQEALDALGELKRELQAQRRPQRQQNDPSTQEAVKIPGADDHQGPREFRQDLLDAMKREAPHDYRVKVKRYYEDLAR